MKTIRPPRNYYNSYLPFHENFKTCISYDVFMFFVNIIFKNVKKNNFSCTVYYQITRKNRINFHFQVIQKIWILGIKIFFLLNKYFFILFFNLFIYFIHKLLHKSFGNYIKFIFVAVNKMFLPYNIEIKQKKKIYQWLWNIIKVCSLMVLTSFSLLHSLFRLSSIGNNLLTAFSRPYLYFNIFYEAFTLNWEEWINKKKLSSLINNNVQYGNVLLIIL